MIACRRWRCPACGFFGRGGRRRALDAAARVHIAWAAALARNSRVRRADSDGLIAVSECRVYVPQPPGWFENQMTAIERDLAAYRGIAMSLHDHTPDEPCNERCSHCPAPGPSDRHALALRQHGEIDDYGTDDVVAEVIGELSYEEQSEIIGDPIADKIIEETP